MCSDRLVGYQVRGENKLSRDTRLCFMTTGILLRRLQGDMSLDGITHVVVDEVHERSIDSDFLLLLLKRVMRVRTDLKVILMRCCSYFNSF
jgi:HrpA-like RNA helicase